MFIAEIFHWVQGTDWATFIRESGLTYPVIMSLHLSSIAVFGGMILMTNLRLLGIAMTDTPAADIIGQLRPWKWAGFVIMVTCGFLLAASKADTYYPNPWFRIKMLLLFLTGMHALAFRRSVYASATPTSSPGQAKLAACISMVLWLGILSMGRWIAYYEAPREQPRQTTSAQNTSPETTLTQTTLTQTTLTQTTLAQTTLAQTTSAQTTSAQTTSAQTTAR